ncbi:MAG: creatininase family protein [bacterium]
MDETIQALADLTTEEAAKFWPEVRGGIVAIGSLEQHGPNLGMSVDTAIADALARRLVQRLGRRVVLLPAVPYGVSYHHMAFTGSLTLRAETLDAIVTDLVSSLAHHNVRRLIVVNGHGGNTAPLATTFGRLRFEGFRIAALSWFGLAGDEAARIARSSSYGHACEVETSIAMALSPHLVRKNALTSGRVKALPFRHGEIRGPARVEASYRFEELTENGALGDARLATVEDGERIASATLERAVAFAEDFLEISHDK